MRYPDNFICATAEYCTREKPVPSHYFRKTVYIEKKIGNAVITICGLGFYKLFLNGEEITNGKLATYPSNPDQVLYYDEYDVTGKLKCGKNVFGVQLGNGMLNCIGGAQWDFDKAPYRSAPKTSFALVADGKTLMQSDTDVKVCPSPILFDDLRNGEHYDARKETPGWCNEDFDDSEWQNALVAERPKGKCEVYRGPAVKVFSQYAPQSIRETDGGFIYEFPCNAAGVCRLKINGTRGQVVKLSHIEALDANGKPFFGNIKFQNTPKEYAQQDVYICKGGKEEYVPSFTYHGFKYVYAEGIRKDQATEGLLTFLEMHAEMRQLGKLYTSSAEVNRICDAVMRSDTSNMFHFPTDCPHREKNGWTGDIAVSAEQMTLLWNTEPMLCEWMKNLRYAQREDGALPGYVPTSGSGYEVWTGPSWDRALFIVPYILHRYRGNKTVLKDNADAMEKYIRYLQTKRDADGCVCFGLGDWCQSTVYEAHLYETPVQITDTLSAILSLNLASRIFRAIGRDFAAERASATETAFRKSFSEKWLNEGGDAVLCPTQTAQAYALSCGIFAQEKQKHAVEELVRRIRAKKYHFDVGIVGGHVLFDVLAENGYADLAYDMIMQKTPPSYRYFENDTTLRESFFDYGTSKDKTVLKNGQPISSLNHHFWGFVYKWFAENLAGLRVNVTEQDCNSATLTVPKTNKVKHIEYFYRFPCGEMNIEWEDRGYFWDLKIIVPQGCKVQLEGRASRETLCGGKYVREMTKKQKQAGDYEEI